MDPKRPFVFFHERLDVYRVSLQFISDVETLVKPIRRGHACPIDQLRRAAMSVTLNIAEGAGERAGPEKRRIYLIALRSANECAAAVDVLVRQGAVREEDVCAARGTLERTTAMLSSLCVEKKT